MLLLQLQIFAYNSVLYRNFSHAEGSPYGLLALSIFLQLGEKPNSELSHLLSRAEKIRYRGNHFPQKSQSWNVSWAPLLFRYFPRMSIFCYRVLGNNPAAVHTRAIARDWHLYHISRIVDEARVPGNRPVDSFEQAYIYKQTTGTAGTPSLLKRIELLLIQRLEKSRPPRKIRCRKQYALFLSLALTTKVWQAVEDFVYVREFREIHEFHSVMVFAILLFCPSSFSIWSVKLLLFFP